MMKKKKDKLKVEKVVFPGLLDNASKLENYGTVLRTLGKDFEDSSQQMFALSQVGQKVSKRLSECSVDFKLDNRRSLGECLELVSQFQQHVELGHEKLAKKIKKHISQNFLHFTNSEIKDAKESTQAYEKIRTELESTKDNWELSRTRKQSKKKPASTPTTANSSIEEQHRHTGAKTAALLLDTLDLSEMTLVESSLKYLETYRKFLESSLRKFQEILPQIQETKRYIDKKRDAYERGDNTKNLTTTLKERVLHKVFGVDLAELVKREGGSVPHFVSTAVDFLRQNNAKNVIGVFRISGQKDEMENFLKALNRFGVIDFSSFGKESAVHNVSGLLKGWLRDLPKSLIPWDYYNQICLINNTRDTETKNTLIQTMIQSLPSPNRLVLHLLLDFLSEIDSNSAINKMDALNLATVIAPNIMFSSIINSDPLLFLSQSAQVNFLVSYIISNAKSIFPESEGELFKTSNSNGSAKKSRKKERKKLNPTNSKGGLMSCGDEVMPSVSSNQLVKKYSKTQHRRALSKEDNSMRHRNSEISPRRHPTAVAGRLKSGGETHFDYFEEKQKLKTEEGIIRTDRILVRTCSEGSVSHSKGPSREPAADDITQQFQNSFSEAILPQTARPPLTKPKKHKSTHSPSDQKKRYSQQSPPKPAKVHSMYSTPSPAVNTTPTSRHHRGTSMVGGLPSQAISLSHSLQSSSSSQFNQTHPTISISQENFPLENTAPPPIPPVNLSYL